jgi:hypothetical protein
MGKSTKKTQAVTAKNHLASSLIQTPVKGSRSRQPKETVKEKPSKEISLMSTDDIFASLLKFKPKKRGPPKKLRKNAPQPIPKKPTKANKSRRDADGNLIISVMIDASDIDYSTESDQGSDYTTKETPQGVIKHREKILVSRGATRSANLINALVANSDNDEGIDLLGDGFKNGNTNDPFSPTYTSSALPSHPKKFSSIKQSPHRHKYGTTNYLGNHGVYKNFFPLNDSQNPTKSKSEHSSTIATSQSTQIDPERTINDPTPQYYGPALPSGQIDNPGYSNPFENLRHESRSRPWNPLEQRYNATQVILNEFDHRNPKSTDQITLDRVFNTLGIDHSLMNTITKSSPGGNTSNCNEIGRYSDVNGVNVMDHELSPERFTALLSDLKPNVFEFIKPIHESNNSNRAGRGNGVGSEIHELPFPIKSLKKSKELVLKLRQIEWEYTQISQLEAEYQYKYNVWKYLERRKMLLVQRIQKEKLKRDALISQEEIGEKKPKREKKYAKKNVVQ